MMKLLFLFFFIILFSNASFGQYYLRGAVVDEKGKPLSGVKIFLQTKGDLAFASGDDGAFGLPSPKTIDTIELSLEGYEPFRGGVPTQKFQVLTLKAVRGTSMEMLNRLNSLTKNLSLSKDLIKKTDMGESYINLIENDFVNANTHPETGFSLNIDRASYSNVRRFLNNKLKAPSEAVRIEQMLNYFNLKPANTTFPSSKTETQFQFNSTVTNCPWNSANKLAFINLQAPKLNLDSIPACNLVFLIDVSGSMDQPNRLPLLQSAFKLLVANLRDSDLISIVTYGGGVRVALYPTKGSEKKQIIEVIDGLNADGDTPGSGAIRTAYFVAKTAFKRGANNRVILATDGDFNVGQSNEQELEEMIEKQKQTGISLTCLGVGMGNYKDSKLETLARKGNGNFAYLDNINEAEKVMVTEFTKTLFNVAEDAYLNITFNPNLVSRYRLIGFDNPRDAITDTSNKLDGGEVGSGHSMMAIFEIEPANKNTNYLSKVATLNLKYKSSLTKEYISRSFDIPNEVKDIMTVDSAYRFATCITMFGSILRGSKYVREYDFDTIARLAETAANMSNYSQKEFLDLLDKADRIYYPNKKRRK